MSAPASMSPSQSSNTSQHEDAFSHFTIQEKINIQSSAGKSTGIRKTQATDQGDTSDVLWQLFSTTETLFHFLVNSYSVALPQDKLLGPVSGTPSQGLIEHLQLQILPGGHHRGPFCKLSLLKTKLKARCAGRACPAVTHNRREGHCCHMRWNQQ